MCIFVAMKRLFIAIPLTPDTAFIQWMEVLKKKLHYEAINMAKPENLHLTLKFLGETPESKIPQILSAIQNGTPDHGAIHLQLDTLGLFGSRYDPRVIWLGSSTKCSELQLLTDSIFTQLDSIGYKRDRQNFVPHITIARIKKLHEKKIFQQVISSSPPLPIQQMDAEQFFLFESTLQKSGPFYTIQHCFQLNKLQH